MPRSVGSIEVTVDANTRKLKATLVTESTKAGRAGAKAMEKELSRVEAKISKIHLDEAAVAEQARKLRTIMEGAVRGIETTLDTTEARRTLRELEAQVDAQNLALHATISEEDIAKANARLRELAAEQRDIKLRIETEVETDQAQLDADLAAINTKLQAFVDEKHVAQVQVEADLAATNTRIKAFTEREREAKIRLQIEFQRATAAYNAWLKEENRKELLLDVGVNTRSASEGVREFAAKLKFAQYDVSIGADIAEAVEQTEFLLAFVDNQDAEIPVDADLKQARIAIDFFRALQEHNDIKIPVDVDALDQAWKTAAARAEAGGKEAGQSYGKGFSSGFGGMFDQGKLIAAAVVSMGSPLATALEGLLSAGTSVVSSGISAIGGAAGAAAPLVAAFGNAMAGVVVGSRGFTEALGAINKEFAAAAIEGREMNLESADVRHALANLSPSAKEAALAFADMRGELSDVRKLVQEQLFSGFADTMRDLGKTVLPGVSKALQQGAGRVNVFAKQLAKVAKETDWSGIAEGLGPALDDAFDAATALAGVVGPFLKAAAPAAERLAEFIERGARGMEKWVKANPDKITEFLDDGIDSLEEWVSLVGSIGDLLGTVFKAGKSQGDSFVQSLDNMISRWDRFLESVEGQDALNEFFDAGQQAMDDMKPVLDALGDALKDLVTGDSLSNFSGLMDALAAAIPVFGDILEFTSSLQLAKAFLTIVDAMRPFVDLLNAIPAPVLEVIGMFVTVAFTMSKLVGVVKSVVGAVKTLGSALTSLGAASPYVIGVGVALTAALALYEQFGNENRAAQQEVDDFTKALVANVEAMQQQAGGTGKAVTLMDAFNKTIKESDDGEKLQKLFGILNQGPGDAVVTMQDAAKVLLDLDRTGTSTLTHLAEGWGLPTDKAKIMADAVNEIDFEGAIKDPDLIGLGTRFQKLAHDVGLSDEATLALFNTLTEIRAIGGKDITKESAESALELARGSDEATVKLLEQAEAQAAAEGKAGDAVRTYQILIDLQGKQKAATDDATTALTTQASAYEVVGAGAALAEQAELERVAALKEAGRKAYDAFKNQQLLNKEIETQASVAAEAFGFTKELAGGFIELGNQAEAAAGKASALKSALDILLSPAAAADEAYSNLAETMAKFDELATGGADAQSKREEILDKTKQMNDELAESNKHAAKNEQEAAQSSRDRAAEIKGEIDELWGQVHVLETAAKSLDLNTEAGRANAEAMRTAGAQALAFAEAQITQGTASDQVIAALEQTRAGLEEAAIGFGKTKEEAKVYVDTLLGTPEFISTLIEQPGLVDALLHADKLHLVYDTLGNPVITEFEELGIDQSILQSGDFLKNLQALGLVDVAPKVDVSGAQVSEEDLAGVNTAVETLDGATAEPTVDFDTLTVDQQLKVLNEGLDALNLRIANPTVQMLGVDATLTQITNLKNQLASIPTTITINVSGQGVRTPGPNRGGQITSMAGRIVRSPMISAVGERGYREAIVPMDLPLNRVDPSVRDFAALIRGEGGVVRLPSGKTVNNYMTITPQAADPVAVATSVINRAAAMAANL